MRADSGVAKAVASAAALPAGNKDYAFGWSRGAIKALYFAQKLNRLGITVEYLGLNDPVNTFYYGCDYDVPANVKAGMMIRNANWRSECPYFNSD